MICGNALPVLSCIVAGFDGVDTLPVKMIALPSSMDETPLSLKPIVNT